jgi:hypothetical protein
MGCGYDKSEDVLLSAVIKFHEWFILVYGWIKFCMNMQFPGEKDEKNRIFLEI